MDNKFKFEDFTYEQRNAMVELVYSYEADILIKTDVYPVLDLMLEKEMICKEDYDFCKKEIEDNTFSVGKIIDVLFWYINEDDFEKIMQEYWK